MKLRRKTALAVVLLGIAAAVIWVLVFRPGEARYDGKPARLWVRQLIEKREHTFSGETDEVARLRRIGVPAVRCLMDAIKREGYVTGKPAYSNLYVRLSPRLAHHLPARAKWIMRVIRIGIQLREKLLDR